MKNTNRFDYQLGKCRKQTIIRMFFLSFLLVVVFNLSQGQTQSEVNIDDYYHIRGLVHNAPDSSLWKIYLQMAKKFGPRPSTRPPIKESDTATVDSLKKKGVFFFPLGIRTYVYLDSYFDNTLDSLLLTYGIEKDVRPSVFVKTFGSPTRYIVPNKNEVELLYLLGPNRMDTCTKFKFIFNNNKFTRSIIYWDTPCD